MVTPSSVTRRPIRSSSPSAIVSAGVSALPVPGVFLSTSMMNATLLFVSNTRSAHKHRFRFAPAATLSGVFPASGSRGEDALAYTEPAEWHYPVRLALGAVLIAAGRPAEAEAVYWRELAIHRDSGLALFGLRQALEARGDMEQARVVGERFDRPGHGPTSH